MAPSDATSAVETASRPCLLVNPKSFRASHGLGDKASRLASELGADVVSIESPAALTTLVEGILERRQARIMVLAGDGTVHAIIDQLARLPAGAWIPDLLILPGGRTNLTAADLAPRRSALASIKLAMFHARHARWDAAVEERAVMRIEQEGSPARHGFFIGAALVDSVIRHVHAHRFAGTGPLQAGGPSAAWHVIKLGLLAMRGRSGLSCPSMAIDAHGLGKLDGPMRVLLLSTLLHRSGLFDPYAERGHGDLRVTAVSRRAPRFLLRLPRLLCGRFSAAMSADAGYLSGRCDRVEIIGLAGISLDGEAFQTDPSRPVVISTGPRLRFLRP